MDRKFEKMRKRFKVESLQQKIKENAIRYLQELKKPDGKIRNKRSNKFSKEQKYG